MFFFLTYFSGLHLPCTSDFAVLIARPVHRASPHSISLRILLPLLAMKSHPFLSPSNSLLLPSRFVPDGQNSSPSWTFPFPDCFLQHIHPTNDARAEPHYFGFHSLVFSNLIPGVASFYSRATISGVAIVIDLVGKGRCHKYTSVVSRRSSQMESLDAIVAYCPG